MVTQGLPAGACCLSRPAGCPWLRTPAHGTAHASRCSWPAPRRRRAALQAAAGASAAAPAGAAVFTVRSECWADVKLYLLFQLDPALGSADGCLDVPAPGICQQYVRLAPGGQVRSAQPTAQRTAWVRGPALWASGSRGTAGWLAQLRQGGGMHA